MVEKGVEREYMWSPGSTLLDEAMRQGKREQSGARMAILWSFFEQGTREKKMIG